MRTTIREPKPDRPEQGARLSYRSFLAYLLLAVLVAAGTIVLWRLSSVIVLAFGAILSAILLRGLADALSRATRIPAAWAVAPVVIALLVAIGAVAWLFGSQIASQFYLLAAGLPETARKLASDFGETIWGAWLLGQLKDINLIGATGQATAYVAAFFGSIFRVLAYLTVLLFAAIYLAIQPESYRHGLLRLVPAERRERAGEIFDLMGATLRRWIVGQSITMTFVGTLTGLGLWALGVGAPLALGLIAGMFAFIPYVGPILAALPGVLMAATQGPFEALYAAALYAGVQFVEDNIIAPLVQVEVIRLPPVLTVFATLVFGLLLGPMGVLLAAPLTVVFLVAVNMLYVEDTLGERRAWPPSGEA